MRHVAVAGAPESITWSLRLKPMDHQKLIHDAVRAFRDGKVVIFPTDTVWGIGAMLGQDHATRRLYSIKGRSEDKPTAVLVNSLFMARRYGVFSKTAISLAHQYWPGALTIIVPAKRRIVSKLVLGGRDGVGVRVPDHPLLLSILGHLGNGIVAGSANVAGGHAPSTWAEIDGQFLAKVDYVVRESSERITSSVAQRRAGVASTVIDTTQTPPVVLRKGPVEILMEHPGNQ